MHRPDGRARETLRPSSQLPLSGSGMSPRLLNSSRAVPAVAKATTAADSKETSTTPPRFSKPMTSGESGSTCLTSSPSPRVRNSESRGGTDAPATSNGGGHSWEGRRGGSNGGADESAATPRRFGGDDSGLPRTSIWTGFDSPPHAASNRRALQRRKCDFKIIVVFRGGWCTSSGNLLKGELVPSWEMEMERERARGHCAAGSPPVALS